MASSDTEIIGAGGEATGPFGESETYDPNRFDWPLAFEAEKFLNERIAAFLKLNGVARKLALRMREETGNDFFDWIDHLVLSPEDEKVLRDAGYSADLEAEISNGEKVLHHARAILPRVILRAGQRQNPSVIALRPESIADLVAQLNLPGDIEGAPFSRYRRVLVHNENGSYLEAVERNAYRGFVTAPLRAGQLEGIIKVTELWHTRKRIFANDAEGFEVASRLLNQSIPLAGRDLTAQIFFASERVYWERRNRAARVQKFRQDQLGLGWGNHDHHTFRSSRAHFVDVVNFLLKLGFEKRERYYAGAEAGWGAQIMEHVNLGIVVFADVDLMPDEMQVDFSVHRLPEAQKLGTVGLWVGLHGESFLEAGMHHLESRFDYHVLREQLEEEGINMMKPFSDFDFLRQAFTEGERWQVNRPRAERLLRAGLITDDQFDKFTKEGAIGSHLENLQRHGGFKGFNQRSVSAVIAATDPRKKHFQPASA
jgi:hypothetical protein